MSAIEAAENPLDRRAMVSLKKQLEIDKPQTSMDFSVSIHFSHFLKFSISSSLAAYQGVPHVLLVRGKPQGTGVRLGRVKGGLVNRIYIAVDVMYLGISYICKCTKTF